jgi:ADP-ribose pyrophosphatase YjhB (NUDIX family)
MTEAQCPKVGISVYIRKDGKVFLGKRKGSHGAGTWSARGGHLEMNESWQECAKREVLEETGLEIGNVRFMTATNDIFLTDAKHYITLAMVATGNRVSRKIWSGRNAKVGSGSHGTACRNRLRFTLRIS